MKLKIFTIVALLLFAASPALSGPYYIWDTWGGSYADAEKTLENTDDDLLCWAAATSNILEYTGWGLVSPMTNTDDIFAHFQDHWTDQGGNALYGFRWWFDGDNDRDSAQDIIDGWAQEDVDGGGGFYPALNHDDYIRWSSDDAAALSNLDNWMHDGYGCTISISGGMAHAITAWGFETDALGNYTHIYVSDSDDDKGTTPTYPDSLRKYSLTYTASNQWHLDNYGSSGNYISEVCGLQMMVIPVPGAVLLGLLGLSVAGIKLRKHA